MDNTEFNLEIDSSINRSKRVLDKKGVEYSTAGGNRLEQFYRAGAAQGITPAQALVGMAMKHVTSISDMAKNPLNHKLSKWNEKVTDLRNYTFLLDALLRDIGVE